MEFHSAVQTLKLTDRNTTRVLRSTTVFLMPGKCQLVFFSTIIFFMPNHFISLNEAVKMTTRFRNNRETVLSTIFKDKDILPKCESFDRAAFEAVLAQDGCTGLRVYFGMNDEDQVNVIIVGVDSNDNDMLPNGSDN